MIIAFILATVGAIAFGCHYFNRKRKQFEQEYSYRPPSKPSVAAYTSSFSHARLTRVSSNISKQSSYTGNSYKHGRTDDNGLMNFMLGTAIGSQMNSDDDHTRNSSSHDFSGGGGSFDGGGSSGSWDSGSSSSDSSSYDSGSSSYSD